MKIPQYARYEYCNKRACDFLEEFHIKSFPVDVESIIHQKNWGFVKYSELMEVFNCSRSQVIHFLGSKDGFTIWDESNYTISYNDDPSFGDRTRFTLMHEVGHIYLHHLTDFEATKLYRGSLTRQENKILENEANAFARNVLVPTSMLQHLKNKDIYNVSIQFGITPTAAHTRLNLYNVDIVSNKQSNVLTRLHSVFYNFYNKKKCSTCGYGTVAKNRHYCPICGNKTLQWGDGTVIYSKLETYDNGKLKECPSCKNEETDIDGDYCQICGKKLINICSNQECSLSPLPSNARYCPVCGNRSTFLDAGFLKEWNYKDNGFMDIPDGIEEELSDGEYLPFN